MATKRDRLLKEIAALKEERLVAIGANAPDDDAAAGEAHPDARTLTARIAELRAEVAALDADKED